MGRKEDDHFYNDDDDDDDDDNDDEDDDDDDDNDDDVLRILIKHSKLRSIYPSIHSSIPVKRREHDDAANRCPEPRGSNPKIFRACLPAVPNCIVE
ncbi:Replicase polyprotein 1a [Dirofilaria immitis]